jgi:hypothetical protein
MSWFYKILYEFFVTRCTNPRLRQLNKLTLYKALTNSAVTYGYPRWESTANAHLLMLQCLQMRLLRATENHAEARGSVVVKALCYKPEGRGIETR